jgi:hypothetical protein
MKQIPYLIVLFSVFVGCNKNDDSTKECYESNNCNNCVIINSDLYNQINTENYTIRKISVNQDCLEIEFGSSGCDGSSWIIDLVDFGAISETTIPQRNLKLRLQNSELCEVFIIRTISFNLKPLQLDNYDELNLKIVDYNSLIRYEY